MKISELIKELEQEMEIHGDVKVHHENIDHPVSGVYFEINCLIIKSDQP